MYLLCVSGTCRPAVFVNQHARTRCPTAKLLVCTCGGGRFRRRGIRACRNRLRVEGDLTREPTVHNGGLRLNVDRNARRPVRLTEPSGAQEFAQYPIITIRYRPIEDA